MPEAITIAVLTASDAAAAGQREDASGRALAEGLAPLGQVVARAVLPDDYAALRAQLLAWCQQGVRLIATTGGTGLGPRDVMPEATRAVIDRELPGMAEAMRQASVAHTPLGMLSRAVAGARGSTLIINFPGSPRAVGECLPVVLPVIPHALDLLAGRTTHQPREKA
jgi:molybdopterin adenylyltransferase